MLVACFSEAQLQEKFDSLSFGVLKAVGDAIGSNVSFSKKLITPGEIQSVLAKEFQAVPLQSSALTGVIVLSDIMVTPYSGPMARKPEPSPWARQILDDYSVSLLGTIAITNWDRRICDIDRTLSPSFDSQSLANEIVKTTRTLIYKAPPSSQHSAGWASIKICRATRSRDLYAYYTDNSHLGIHEASDIPIFTFSYLYYFASLHAAGLARSGRPVYVHWNGLANTRLK